MFSLVIPKKIRYDKAVSAEKQKKLVYKMRLDRERNLTEKIKKFGFRRKYGICT